MVTITFNCKDEKEKEMVMDTINKCLSGWLPMVNSEIKLQPGERNYSFQMVLNPQQTNTVYGIEANVEAPTPIDAFVRFMNEPIELIHMTYKDVKNLIKDYLRKENITEMSDIDKQLYKFASACPEHIKTLYPNKWLQAYETMATLGYFGAEAPHLCSTDFHVKEN